MLPVAFNGGRAYFLFSREWIGARKDAGMWSDFGGKTEKGESQFRTAVREAHEESMGLMGDTEDIEELINTSKIGEVDVGCYKTYLVEVEYDESVPRVFQQEFQKAPKKLVSARNGLYEKDLAAWVRSDNVPRFAKNFRNWYRRSGIPFRAASIVNQYLKDQAP